MFDLRRSDPSVVDLAEKLLRVIRSQDELIASQDDLIDIQRGLIREQDRLLRLWGVRSRA